MNIGKLNKRITIEQQASGRDDGGERTGSWNEVATIWARELKRAGKETTDDLATVVDRSRTFEARYRSDLTTDMRISYDSGYWQITDIRVIGLNDKLEIDAMHKSNW